MDLMVVGSVATDDIKTPFGEVKGIAGGSATHFSIAASRLADVGLVGVVGSDYPDELLEVLKNQKIDLRGLEKKDGKSFHWKGYYEYDMNSAHTLDTQLGVFADFEPSIPDEYKKSKYVFLANIDPDLQIRVLEQLDKPEFIFLDTMNFWIESKRDSLERAIQKVDGIVFNEGEARQFCNTPNLVKAGNMLMEMGPDYVIIKKGEHGSLLFSKNFSFATVAYPTETIIDPTGAGDSFAGGFMGYIAKQDNLKEDTLKEAVIFGSVTASFMVEDFSYKRLLDLELKDYILRYNALHNYVKFDTIKEL